MDDWNHSETKQMDHVMGAFYLVDRKVFEKINGFDETYVLPSVGEDIDLGWRFRGLGIELKSCKHNANLIHLYHKKRFDGTQRDINDAILKKNFDVNRFFCSNGIIKNKDC